MSRPDAIAKVLALGGKVHRRVNPRTDALVIGSDGWPMRASGRLTRNLELAEELVEGGQRLAILGEHEFLRLLNGEEHVSVVHRTYSLPQLSRLAGVSGLRLRRWAQRGLIRPVADGSPAAQFEYSQVKTTKTLVRLLARGVRPTRLLHSLQRLQRWLPADATLADHLVSLQRQLLVRDGSGRLLDAGGQLYFDFEPASGQVSLEVVPAELDADSLYDRAYELESRGAYQPAIDHYQQWLELYGDDADVWFNLANTLWATGALAEAVTAYQRCLEVDQRHQAGWNNLGLCLEQLGDAAGAVRALQKAVQLAPANADSCLNLTELLNDASADKIPN